MKKFFFLLLPLVDDYINIFFPGLPGSRGITFFFLQQSLIHVVCQKGFSPLLVVGKRKEATTSVFTGSAREKDVFLTTPHRGDKRVLEKEKFFSSFFLSLLLLALRMWQHARWWFNNDRRGGKTKRKKKKLDVTTVQQQNFSFSNKPGLLRRAIYQLFEELTAWTRSKMLDSWQFWYYSLSTIYNPRDYVPVLLQR